MAYKSSWEIIFHFLGKLDLCILDQKWKHFQPKSRAVRGRKGLFIKEGANYFSPLKQRLIQCETGWGPQEKADPHDPKFRFKNFFCFLNHIMLYLQETGSHQQIYRSEKTVVQSFQPQHKRIHSPSASWNRCLSAHQPALPKAKHVQRCLERWDGISLLQQQVLK